MKGLIDNGASAITVHLRYTDDRPRVPCHKEYFPILFNAMKEYAPHIPICYNGDIFSHDDVQSLRALYPSIGLMIGRGAILNMGVFKGVQTSFDETNKEFIQLCAKYNNGFANTKYTAFRVITEGNHQTLDSSIVLHDAHDWETLGSAYGVGEECVRILEDLREKGLTIDENLRKNDGGQHRKSKKRNSANMQTLPSSSSDSKQSKQEEK